MTTPSVRPVLASKTSPQFASALRNIMFLDRVFEKRNEEYLVGLKQVIAGLEKKHKMAGKKPPTRAERKTEEERFTSSFYQLEVDALATFNLLVAERTELRKQKEPIANSTKERLQILDWQVDSGPEAYIAQSMYDPQVVQAFKQRYSNISLEIKAELKKVASEHFPHLKNVAYQPAMVHLFNEKYPGLKPELDNLSVNIKDFDTNIAAKQLAKCGSAMLKVGSFAANPSGFLVSRAISGIIMSDAMTPFRSKVSESVSRVYKNSGLKESVKQLFQSDKGKMYKNVMIGCAVATAGTLVVMGVLEMEDAQTLKASILETLNGMSIPELGQNNVNTFTSSEALSQYGAQYMGEAASLGNESVGDILTDMYVDSSPGSPVLAASTGSDTATYINSLMSSGDAPSILSGVPEKVSETLADVPNVNDPLAEVLSVIEKQSVVTQGVELLTIPVDVPSTNLMDSLAVDIPEVDSHAVDNLLPSEPVVPVSSFEPLSSTYTVVNGDTLSEIVQERLSLAGIPYSYEMIDDYVDLITRANDNILDKDLIYPGNTIDLSSLPVAENVFTPEVMAELRAEIQTPEMGVCDSSLDIGLPLEPIMNSMSVTNTNELVDVGLKDAAARSVDQYVRRVI